MTRALSAAVLVALAGGALLAATTLAPARRAAAAEEAGGGLERPADLRTLVFLSSGHGMAYGPAAAKAGASPPFTNVFVTPAAYREFMRTGRWPEGTAFFLEVRASVEHASIQTAGSSQGPLLALEAEVKDSRRFPDGGWGYFDFGEQGRAARGRQLPRSAGCADCHSRHGAVEWTFTQFYPEQFAVAQRLGTVRADYDPELH